MRPEKWGVPVDSLCMLLLLVSFVSLRLSFSPPIFIKLTARAQEFCNSRARSGCLIKFFKIFLNIRSVVWIVLFGINLTHSFLTRFPTICNFPISNLLPVHLLPLPIICPLLILSPGQHPTLSQLSLLPCVSELLEISMIMFDFFLSRLFMPETEECSLSQGCVVCSFRHYSAIWCS